MSQPGAALEASIAAELERLKGADPAADEPPADETPPEGDEPPEEGAELEAEGPDETEEEEGEDEGEDEGGERVDAAPPPKAGKRPGRANARIQEAVRRAQDAEARLAAIEAQRVADEQRRQAEAQAAEDRRMEAEIAALPPEDQPVARDRVQLRRLTNATLNTQRQLADLSDQQAFSAVCQADPLLKAFAPRIEQIAAAYRAQGNVVNRETIGNFLVGQYLRTPEGRKYLMQNKPAKKQKRTPTSRGDGGGGGRTQTTRKGDNNSRDALKARLAGKPI